MALHNSPTQPANAASSFKGGSQQNPTSVSPPPISPSSGAAGIGIKSDDIEATTLISLNKQQEEQIIKYAAMSQVTLTNQYSMRWNMEQLDREYMRENDWTPDQIKSRIANKGGDATRFQDLTVPIIMPQVQAALGYMVNVFLTGYPIFGVTSDPSNEDAALQMETIIGENSVTAGWARELTMFFRDGLKYNFCAIECDWAQENVWTIKTNPEAKSRVGADPVKTLWQGNKLKRLDLYNSFWDPRVAPSKMHRDGEFVGYTEIFSRSKFKAYMNSLYNKVPPANVMAALAAPAITGTIGTDSTAPFGYYQPIINPFPFFSRQSGFDWMSWATNTVTTSNGANFANIYSVTTFYARIIPADFDLRVPEKNTPQVWRFRIINGKVVLSAERMTNVHGYIPVFFGQPIEDGLDYQTKSFASNVSDMQYLASAMWRSYIASKRRLIGDRVLYDPSRIKEKDINSTNPSAKIPVRPSAYGKPLDQAVYQFPFRDEMTESLIQGSAAVISFANQINGQNPAQQGQFVKGNKTKHEYDDIMGHGNNNNQVMAMSFENTVFTPMKEVIKLNILQYQPEAVMYNPTVQSSVQISPTDLRKEAIHFKVSDGLTPADKMTGEDMMQTVLQTFGSSPQLAAGFNLAPMFVYSLKTQGLDLTPFAKSQAQQQYEQALNAWQQAAMQAAKSGAAFSTPQPQPSGAYAQELQQSQQNGGAKPSVTSSALEATQGAQ